MTKSNSGGRLVIVSNRVSLPKKGAQAGGLAVALRDALQRQGGLWFGWSGEVIDSGQVPPPKTTTSGGISVVTTGLSRQDYEEFYNGYSNSTLWPLFHYRLGLLEVSRKSYEGYLRVNASFAQALAPLLRPDDVIWIHDYHLIPLGAELRRLGVTNRMGFFLHTPFPVPELLLALPGHRRLIRAMCAYDQVGFQTQDDVRAFLGYLDTETGGEITSDGRFAAFGRRGLAKAYPIGIDTTTFTKLAARQADALESRRLKQSLQGHKLVIGVERLDYSKGLPHRFEAIETLLEGHPELRRTFEFMQIAAPSREEVARYRNLKRQLEGAAGRINGRYAEFDWQPVRYLNKSYSRATLAGFYRSACVGLVTPQRDGMNLVAKEYVAAQNPEDPGVLVLSRFAGAAKEMKAALIVNPFDVDEMADALAKALTMPQEERYNRWRTLMDVVEGNTVETWRNAYLSDLTTPPEETGDDDHAVAGGTPILTQAAVPPLKATVPTLSPSYYPPGLIS